MTDADLHAGLAAFAAGDAAGADALRAALASRGLDGALLGEPADAAVLLELLGDGPGLLAGMHVEVDVSDAVMTRLFGSSPELPVAEAVRSAAGPFDGADQRWAGVEAQVGPAVRDAAGEADVWPAVAAAVGVDQVVPRELWLSALLDNELRGETRDRAVALVARDPAVGPEMTRLADVGRLVREAVTREAGPAPALWSRVGPEVGVVDPEHVPGWDGAWFAATLRAAAGPIDVTDAVLAAVRVDLVEAPELPAAANTRGDGAAWTVVAAVAMAAAMLLAVVWQGSEPEVRQLELPDMVMEFASAGEVNVDRIHSGPDSSVFVEVPSGADGPLIIWVDDPGGG